MTDKIEFEWIENPEKDIAESTAELYSKKLNILARAGYKTKDDLLNNATAVRDLIDSKGGRQTKSVYYAAVFYIIGRVSVEEDPRRKPLVEGFQNNYYQKK
jgi:hypothetical protein